MTTQCYHFTPAHTGPVWSPEDSAKHAPARPNASDIYRPDLLDHIEETIKFLDAELRELSLDLHSMLPLKFAFDNGE